MNLAHLFILLRKQPILYVCCMYVLKYMYVVCCLVNCHFSLLLSVGSTIFAVTLHDNIHPSKSVRHKI